MSCSHRHDAAAYVLGALDPAERVRFEPHLPTCADCTAAVRAMTELPGLLAHVNAEDVVIEPTPPPPGILSGLLKQVRRQRRTRIRRTVLVTAAALVLVAAGTVTTVEVLRPATAVVTGPESVSAEFAPVGDLQSWGEAELVPFPEGTQIRMDCSYSLPDDSSYGALPYRLVVTNELGETDVAGSWRANDGTSREVTLFTRWDFKDISAMEVQYLDGEPILRWEK